MVFEKIRDLICKSMDIPREDFVPQANIREDFDLDSLDLVDIVMDIEDRFGVEISEDDMEKLVTVKDVVDYIEARA